MNIEQLNDYIIEHIGMELMDDEQPTSVKETIEGWEKSIKSEEFKNDNHDSDYELINELKKFKDYDCLYSIDYKHGGVFGQGFIIVNQDLNYIDFIRTI